VAFFRNSLSPTKHTALLPQSRLEQYTPVKPSEHHHRKFRSNCQDQKHINDLPLVREIASPVRDFYKLADALLQMHLATNPTLFLDDKLHHADTGDGRDSKNAIHVKLVAFASRHLPLVDDTLLKNSRPSDGGTVAIDLGCNDAIAWTTSDENGLVSAPRFFRKAEQRNKQLGKAKRRKRAPNFKKKIKASRRWKKSQKLVSKLNRKVANQRQNFVHQETTRIISSNSTVVTEKLEVKNMSAKAKKAQTCRGDTLSGKVCKRGKRKKQKAGLNKSILDVGMGMIKDALKAKLSDIGGLFVEVPTRKVKPSQTCPKCGYQEKKTLDQRTHVCNNCGYTQQRDIASAEVMLLWYSTNLQGLGTSLLDVDDCSSTSNTSKRKNAGSMYALRVPEG
jgi:transposase